MSTPQRCRDPHDCGRYLPHHAECCPCAQGMSERWADAANRLLNVVEAATDLLWKATQYGETEDGDTAAYILPKGTVHRLVGVVQGAGFSASLRASPAPTNESLPAAGHDA